MNILCSLSFILKRPKKDLLVLRIHLGSFRCPCKGLSGPERERRSVQVLQPCDPVQVLQPCDGKEVGVSLFFPIFAGGEPLLNPWRWHLLPQGAQLVVCGGLWVCQFEQRGMILEVIVQEGTNVDHDGTSNISFQGSILCGSGWGALRGKKGAALSEFAPVMIEVCFFFTVGNTRVG